MTQEKFAAAKTIEMELDALQKCLTGRHLVTWAAVESFFQSDAIPVSAKIEVADKARELVVKRMEELQEQFAAL